MFDLDLSYWVGAFLLSSALLGIMMYTLICLFDLENDFINPHDATNRINKMLLPYRFLQVLLTGLLLVRAEWWLAAPNLAVIAWQAWRMVKCSALMDVTEIFNQLASEKRIYLVKLGVHLLLFLCVIYRLVESSVVVLMESHGPTITKTILDNVVPNAKAHHSSWPNA